MVNKCPKCNEKLSMFYIKQNCPVCGCNLASYNIDKELEKDAEKAEAEFKKLNDFVSKITSVFQHENKQ